MAPVAGPVEAVEDGPARAGIVRLDLGGSGADGDDPLVAKVGDTRDPEQEQPQGTVLDQQTPVMSVFKGSGREIPSAVMSRLPSMMQAGAVEGGN
jgi:hypothetical protein